METLRTDFQISMILTFIAEIERLKAENEEIRKEKADLEAMMEMSVEHADEMGADLLSKVNASKKESEERISLISETIPVPIIVSRVSDGRIMYANKHLLLLFGATPDDISKYDARQFYENPDDRKRFVEMIDKHGHLNDFQVRLKNKVGKLFWASLFSQSLNFGNNACILTVIYDLTERREAEEKIRKLTEELEKAKQREEKYLMFVLADREFGIRLSEIREIVGIMPLTQVPHTSDFVKGVANLRGRVIPVADIRSVFEMEAAANTERSCIVVVEFGSETGKQQVGIIADSVTQVLGIKGKDMEPAPVFDQKTDMRFISGMAKVDDDIAIILDIRSLWKRFSADG